MVPGDWQNALTWNGPASISPSIMLSVNTVAPLSQTRRNTLLSLVSAVSLLSLANLFAENAILEDFEDSIDSVSQGDWGGPRIPDYVTFEQYTKTGVDDINVTHGNKSLKMDLSAEGWCLDARITLSDEASQKVHEAVKSSDVARYLLRFDVIFPGGTDWMNEQVFLGTHNDQLDTPSAANGGKTTIEILFNGTVRAAPTW